MKNFMKSALQDDDGNTSSMRLMSLISLLAAIGIAVLPFFVDNHQGDNLHVLYFLTAAFAPKTVQKFAERKPK